MIVLKYELQVGRQRVMLPIKRKILSAQIQREALCLWVVVDNRSKLEDVVIYVVGTGQSLDPFDFPDIDHLPEYIATAQGDGAYVWHVFVEPQGGV